MSTGRPTIVCLCGSTRFGNYFTEANLKATLNGQIVLSIGCDTKSDQGLGLTEADKLALDELHLHKVDLADYVLVVSDPTGYFGESTAREIAHARGQGKDVVFVEHAAYLRAVRQGLVTDADRKLA